MSPRNTKRRTWLDWVLIVAFVIDGLSMASAVFAHDWSQATFWLLLVVVIGYSTTREDHA